jgi:hypothetical protein
MGPQSDVRSGAIKDQGAPLINGLPVWDAATTEDVAAMREEA